MAVLVVDDERTIREAVARALRMHGYDVALAADGDQALQTVAVLRPEVIVLDLMMPRVDGIEVCKRLRASGARVPVLMLTARDAIADRVEGLEAGADDYLVKPFALDELIAACARCCAAPARRRATNRSRSATSTCTAARRRAPAATST